MQPRYTCFAIKLTAPEKYPLNSIANQVKINLQNCLGRFAKTVVTRISVDLHNYT